MIEVAGSQVLPEGGRWRHLRKWLVPVLAASVSTVLALTALSHGGQDACDNGNCININGVEVVNVRFRGEVLSLAKFRESGRSAAATVVAPLSAETGYVWAFETQAEADQFNKALIVLERECWVPGTCRG